MKIQTKLIYLLFVVVALFSSVIIIFWRIDHGRMIQLVESKKQEKELLLERTTLLLQKPIELFVYDYSYWDEMLEFSKKPDSGWAYVNVDMVLTSFGAQGAWVFNHQHELVYSANTTGDPSFKASPVSDSAWNRIRTNNYFTHYYQWNDSVLVELFGAPIQPSNDITRVTEPQGSFFAGRVWDSAFIRKLEDINNGSIQVKKQIEKRTVQDNETISFVKPLHGWDSSAVGYIHGGFRSPVISEINRLSQYQIGLLILFGAVLIIPLIFFLRRWIVSPLQKLSAALTREDPSELLSSNQRSEEFKNIAILVHLFFKQRIELVKEFNIRKQTEQDYRNLFDFAHDAIMIVDHESMNVLRVNEAWLKLYGYVKEDLTDFSLYTIWPQRASVKKFLDEIQSFQSANRFEANHFDSSKRERIIEINARMIRYQSREALFCVSRDISESRVIESMQLSHTILMRVRNLVLVSNKLGHIIYANHAVKDLLGYEPSDVLGEGWWRLTRDAAEGNLEKKIIQQAATNSETIQTTPYERWIRDRWGNRRCIIWSDSPAPGNLVIGVGYDITDRVKAQRALEESELRYRFLFDHIPIPMMIFQARTYAIIAVNQSAMDLFGYTKQNWPAFQMKEWIEQASGSVSVRESSEAHEIRMFRKPDGSMIDIELQYHDFRLADQSFRLVILFDLTQKEKTDNADLRLRKQKSHLSGVIEALEDERRRMAYELHDGLGQILSGAKRILESLSPETGLTDDKNRMDVVTQMLDNALAETKSIAFNLLPRTLEDFGLNTAVESLLRQQFDHSSIRVNFQTHDIPERMPYYMELALYRIVQEAMNNIIKHANATEVSVQFVGYESVIVLTIEDNGIGFDAGLPHSGLGLRSIKDRVAYLDGNLHIDSTNQQGTSLIIEIPKYENV